MCAWERTTALIERGSKGNVRLRAFASSRLPWNMPQSRRIVDPPARSRCMEPVTVRSDRIDRTGVEGECPVARVCLLTPPLEHAAVEEDRRSSGAEQVHGTGDGLCRPLKFYLHCGFLRYVLAYGTQFGREKQRNRPNFNCRTKKTAA